MSLPTLVLKDKLKEALFSVMPIVLIVFILSFTAAPIPAGSMLAFIFGAALLVLGNAFFTLGAEMSMSPMGERIGAKITKTRNIAVIILVCFVIGSVITISEPDLQVLADQVASVSTPVLIGAVAAGVGFFLVLAVLRSFFRIKISHILIFLYTLVFALSYFVPSDFLSIAFDSGGVTTGPMTVPFIIALGVGVASVRSDRRAKDDSFGLVALCSIGPIIAVLILGMIYSPDDAVYESSELVHIADSKALRSEFAHGFPEYFAEVAISLAPIAVCFLIFKLLFLKLPKKQNIKVIVGMLYTYIGLVLFLTGVNVGFMPVGNYLGAQIANLEYNFIIIPIGMLIGYFIVAAEPAVFVLNKQVEDITDGAIPRKVMGLSLSFSIAISLGLAMTRVLTGISIIYFVIPGYAIALLLSFFVPPMFTSIAFDSGGVASGPMTATFLLPFAMGACEATGGNVITDAFGIIAMVAMTPLITIQILGLCYKFKLARTKTEEIVAESDESGDDIIEL